MEAAFNDASKILRTKETPVAVQFWGMSYNKMKFYDLKCISKGLCGTQT